MFNIVLTAALTSFVILSGLFLGAFFAFKYLKSKVLAVFYANFIPADSATPTPFALIVQSIASTFGTEIAAHLKATFLGLQSVDAKNERREAAAGIIGGNSILGAILSSFPAVGKKISKNPAMAALADMAINRFTGGPRPAGNESNNHEFHPVQFKF